MDRRAAAIAPLRMPAMALQAFAMPAAPAKAWPGKPTPADIKAIKNSV
jgi:hypothetical protein